MLYVFFWVIPRLLNILHTYPPMKREQCVPKRRHIKFRRREITQEKAYNSVIFLSAPARPWMLSVTRVYMLSDDRPIRPKPILLKFHLLYRTAVGANLFPLHSLQAVSEMANTAFNCNNAVTNTIIYSHWLQQVFRPALACLVTDGRRSVPATIFHLLGNQ